MLRHKEKKLPNSFYLQFAIGIGFFVLARDFGRKHQNEIKFESISNSPLFREIENGAFVLFKA